MKYSPSVSVGQSVTQHTILGYVDTTVATTVDIGETAIFHAQWKK